MEYNAFVALVYFFSVFFPSYKLKVVFGKAVISINKCKTNLINCEKGEYKTYWKALLLACFGCWSPDRTTARLGEHQQWRKGLLLNSNTCRFIKIYKGNVSKSTVPYYHFKSTSATAGCTFFLNRVANIWSSSFKFVRFNAFHKRTTTFFPPAL